MSFIKKWCPIIVFLFIYLCTSFIGTVLLIFGPESYWKLTYLFTGQSLPNLYKDQVALIFLIIFSSLAFLILGYFIGSKIIGRKNNKFNMFPDKKRSEFVPICNLLFWIVSFVLLFKLFSIVGVDGIASWLSFNQFIEKRLLIMQNLSFVEYILIYTIAPCFLAISSIQDIKQKKYIFLAAKSIMLVLLNLYIFQKRSLCNAFLLIAFTCAIHFFLHLKLTRKKVKKVCVVACGLILGINLVYVAGIYLNTLNTTEEIYLSATEQIALDSLRNVEISDDKKENETIEKKEEPYKKFELEAQTFDVTRPVFINTMAFVGLLNRTAFYSIYYPVIFPKHLDYYPLDLGQDILGFGQMPDDAIKVYALLNPQNPVGSGAAPFFVVLYSQGGILVSIIGSFLVGLCFGLFWTALLHIKQKSLLSSLYGGLALYFAVLLAMASGRDSVLSSYGVIYPVAFLTLIYFVLNLSFFKNRKVRITHKVCMLVTSGVVNDSRIIREATISAEKGFEILMVGRHVPRLGAPDKNWKFSHKLIDIPRAEGNVFAKIAERMHLGFSLMSEAIKYKPDLIHCNDFDTLLFGYLAAKACDSALVYDSHELWSENELVSRSRVGKKVVKIIEGFLARRCDCVISVSNAAGEWLKNQYNLENVLIVTNCPVISNVKYQPKEETFELLIHGIYSHDRGYEEVIECSKLLEKENINVRIRAYGHLSDYYLDLISKTGQKNLILSPKVPSDQVVSAASASHVGVAITRPVSLSYKLTVSNKIFEYLAAGLPVIMSDVPEHRYLNDKYHFGIILDAITPEAIAGALIELKNTPKLYGELAKNALNASSELCFEKEGEKLVNLYNEILKIEEEIFNNETSLT